MQWTELFTVFSNLFVLPFGSAFLAGVVLTVIVLYACVRAGLGTDGSIIIGGGFLLLFSVWMLPWDMTVIIVMALMTLFALGVLRLWRK